MEIHNLQKLTALHTIMDSDKGEENHMSESTEARSVAGEGIPGEMLALLI